MRQTPGSPPHQSPSPWGNPSEHWSNRRFSRRHWPAKRRRAWIWRFIAGFGIIYLLFLVSLGVVIGLVAGSPGAAFANPGVWVLAACGVPLVFTLAIALIGSSYFRRIGAPLADVMAVFAD